MSLLPKINFPGLGAYLSQGQRKHEEGIFRDIFRDIEATETYKTLIEDILGQRYEFNFKYKGKLDGRFNQLYPYPAKEGHFWLVAYAGHIGNHIVAEGDCLVRLTEFASDWTLIASDEKYYSTKIDQVNRAYEKKPKPTTKAAPAPGKRKVILED